MPIISEMLKNVRASELNSGVSISFCDVVPETLKINMEEEDNSAINYSVLRQKIQHVLHSLLFGGAVQKKLRLLWLIRTTLRRHLFPKTCSG